MCIVGVPTVVDAATLVNDITGGKNIQNSVIGNPEQMMVTPREIDLLIERASRLISHAINCALQPHIAPHDLLALTAG